MKPGTIIALLIAASIPAYIAHKKGRSTILFYFLGLVTTPLIATIIIACLNNKNNPTDEVSHSEIEHSDNSTTASVQRKTDNKKPLSNASDNPALKKPALIPENNDNEHQKVVPSNPMFCRKCGKDISGNRGFCRFCGTKVSSYTPLEVSNLMHTTEKRNDASSIPSLQSVPKPIITPIKKDELGQSSSKIQPESFAVTKDRSIVQQEDTSKSRLETLYEIDPCSIQDNIPVLIEKISLIVDHQTATLFVRSIFRSLTDTPIIAMLVDVCCKDIWGEETTSVEGFQFIDLKTTREALFGQNISINIPDCSTRMVDVVIKKILHADRTIIDASTCNSKLEKQKPLSEFFGNEELKNEYIRETTQQARYTTVQGKNYWRCACGAINTNKDQACYRCKANKDLLVSRLNIELISSNLFAIKEEKRIKQEKAIAEREARLRQEQEQRRKAIEERVRIAREEAERKAEILRQKTARRKRIFKRTAIISASIVFLSFAVYAIGWHLIPYMQYTKADRLLAEQSFDEAYAAFDALGSFSDSKSKAADSIYQKGSLLMSKGDYIEAANAFELILKHKDSTEKAAFCRNEDAYLKAKTLFDEKKYLAASDAFSALSDYSDSADWALESNYLYAQALLDSGEYEEAHTYFMKSPSYKNSKPQANECFYQYATKLLEEKDYIAAYSYFSEISIYKDSKALSNECYYQYATNLFNDKKYEEAHTYFTKISYKDSKSYAKESYYLLAKEYYAKGQYEKSHEFFTKVKDYKDSETLADECYYLLGNQLYTEQKYNEAYEVFCKIASYKDSQDLANEAEYLYAIESFDAEKFEQSITAFKIISDYKDSNTRLQEAKYQYAISLSSNSKWKEAFTLFKELDRYKDCQNRYKETYYQYGLQLYKEKKYTNAVIVFQSLGYYQESQTKMNEARYAYVKANKNNTDTTTYKYLTELKKSRYKDSDKIYNSLYAWKCELIAFNTTADNNKIISNSITRFATYLHIELKLQGGPPGEKVTLTHRIYWPDGSVTYSSWDWENCYRGTTFGAEWDKGLFSDPSNAKKGTLTVKVYIKQTGECIGGAAIQIY